MSLELPQLTNQFSSDIFKNCIAEKTENVILSPISIQIALSLLFMGAKGKTADEMSSVMNYENISRDKLANNFEQLMASSSNMQMKIANKIYVMEGYAIKQSFNEIAKSKFLSEVQNINFAENQKSANEINKWIEEKTNEKIKNLVLPEDFNDYTRIFIVNAIYFKGTWDKKFDKDATKLSKFWVNESQSINVPMMHVKAYFGYGIFEDLDAVGLEMPYKDSDISMFAFLPNKRDGLKKLEADLSQINYSTLTDKMSIKEVDVSFPKFKIESKFELHYNLKEMGMNTMFTGGADFSDLLDSTENLKVSNVVQKAFINVDEGGTEAAAATVAALRSSAGFFDETVYFIADHPFVFFLKDYYNVIYFSGHVYNIL